MSKTISLEAVKRKMERMFIPNIVIVWDEKLKSYVINPYVHTEDEMQRLDYHIEGGAGPDIAGAAWLKRYNGGINFKVGRVIPKSYLEGVLQSLGNCGIVYQIEEPE